MKGQNCEARFSYRGFAATSKVHIKQSTNVVASLTLTPATDPRIASINFPCGDLSAATTFQVTDTAILAGTNEIGGIYVGLATNMANVAQAQFYGGIQGTGVTTNPSTTAATLSNLSGGVFTASLLGNVTSYDAATMAITFSSMPAGEYFVTSPLIYAGASTECRWSMYEDTSAQYAGDAYTTGTSLMQLSARFTFSSAATRTFRLRAVRAAGTNACATEPVGGGGGGPVPGQFLVYRFPSSSELVVTPERQNTFGGVKYVNSNQSIRNTAAPSASYQEYNNAVWNQPTLLIGKAAVTTTGSGNDLGFSMPNLPVGQYKVSIRGLINASTENATTLGHSVNCSFKIRETIAGTDVALQVHRDTVSATTPTSSRDYEMSFFGVFNNTSVATRNFRLEAAKVADSTTGSVGTCQAYSNTAFERTEIVFLIEPLDQPSNSALYVQGPVLGAQTGAAIPSGYLGKSEFGGGTGTVGTSATTGATTYTISNVTPGVYLTRLYGAIQNLAPNTTTFAEWTCTLTDNAALTFNAYDVVNYPQVNIGGGGPNGFGGAYRQHSSNSFTTTVTSTKNYYVRCAIGASGSGITVTAGAELIRLN
jgi:hypothetical protein